MLEVAGRVDVARLMPLPAALIEDLSAYRVRSGLNADPADPGNRGAHLIGQASDVALRAPWSPQAQRRYGPCTDVTVDTLYNQVKKLFAEAADVLATTNAAWATRLRAESTRWLHHTRATHAMAAGGPLHALQLGHASIDTTAN